MPELIKNENESSVEQFDGQTTPLSQNPISNDTIGGINMITTPHIPTAMAEDVIDYISLAIGCCEAAGVDLIASDGEALLEGISDHEQAAAELRELARLIELYGQKSAPQVGEVA